MSEIANTQQLVKVGDKSVSADFGGVVKADWRLQNAKEALAIHFGITLKKGDKMPDLKAAVEAAGFTKDEFKLARKSYDTGKNTYHASVRKVNALFASDPNYRQSIRQTKTGAVTTYRKVAVSKAHQSDKATIAMLRAKLAELGIEA